jgi:hypothetical protein
MNADENDKLRELLGWPKFKWPQFDIFLETEDEELSKELDNLKIEDVEIVPPVMQADWGEVFKHIVTFASDKGIELFFIWFTAKMIKQKSRKTTVNKHQIPFDETQLTELVKIIKKEIETKKKKPKNP